MKHGKKNINRKWIITAIVCVAVLVFAVIYACCVKLLNPSLSCAQPDKITVASDFDISINSTSIAYDEASSSDVIFINTTVKNNSSFDERLIECFYINARQESADILVEPVSGRDDDIQNNSTALSAIVDSGQSVDVLLAFCLADYSDVCLDYYGFIEGGGIDSPISVTLPVHKTFNVWWNEICNWWDVLGKQNVQTVKVANFDVPLADGWYAETQGTVASVFKNPKYEGAQITMSASSGVSASDLAAQSGQIAGVNAQVQTFDIKGKTYYGFETQNGFVLCIDGEDGLTLRIFGQGITLDQATPLLP